MMRQPFRPSFALAVASFLLGLLVWPALVANASHYKPGNERQEEYRAPWAERYKFYRTDGCPVQAVIPPDDAVCTGHTASSTNGWAIDLNDVDRPGNADCGDPLKATRNGSTLLYTLNQGGGYGRTLGVRHVGWDGLFTSSWYSHLEAPVAEPWDTVFVQGDWIGALGNSGGSSYGCHLHFQVNTGHGSQFDGAQTRNVVLSGTAFVDGFDLLPLSDNPTHTFNSNNTGAGYCRPGAPSWLDPGSDSSPCVSEIRTYVRNAAVYAIDIGSTKASTRGACGGNRRWIKVCSTPSFGTIYAQGFVSQGLFGQIPRAVVRSGGVAFSVDGHFWKAYGRKCTINGVNRWVYEHLGAPATEDEWLSPAPNLYVQYFPGGSILKNDANASNIVMTVGLNGGGTCSFSNVLDTNNDPCYDLNGDSAINPADQGLRAAATTNAPGESSPLWNDRYDVNRDGVVNPGDAGLIGGQIAAGLTCR